MTDNEIIKYIDDGAIFYLDFFGDAVHMKSTDNGVYRMIRPKENKQGVKFIYDLRLDHLTDDEAKTKITEMKLTGLPVWWPLHSKRIRELLHGKDFIAKPPSEGDEFYMALLPDSQPSGVENDVEIKHIKTPADFKIWADMANLIFAGGYGDIHAVNHYHWCEKDRLFPYIAYQSGTPAAIAAFMNNNGVASLEFVATLNEYRRKGLARAVCIAAVREAFMNGAIVITTRAFHPASLLYQSLGFKIYY